MQKSLERMQAALREWLIKEGIFNDADFISIDNWRGREENFLDDALLVLVFDSSGLFHMMDAGCDTSEFDDLVESFGFRYELGHAWNMGFYPIEEYDYSLVSGSYAEKLRDPRWIQKARKIKQLAENKCQDCGASAALEAHHCYYLSMKDGYQPWEYPFSAFRALCRACHISREKAEIRMRAYMAKLNQDEMEALMKGFDHACYWFSRSSVTGFLQELGPHKSHLEHAIHTLTEGQIEHD